jgi:L-rhamnonate dehydratase
MEEILKIIDVEAIYVRLPDVKDGRVQDALIIKVHTNEGITGIGEVHSAPLAAQGAILGPYCSPIRSGLKHLILNQDPFETEVLWERMYRCNIYSGRSGVTLHAMSGIDMALWDIKGKKLGMPIWKLLGGGFQKKIRCYASSWFGATPTETRERAKYLAGLGFSAVKFGWAPMGLDADNDVALVAKAREGLGEKLDLMVDGGLAWDAHTAIERARAFSEYGIFWLEEPLAPDDYEGYRKLTGATNVRIAAGEEESSRYDFQRLIFDGKIDVVQVDLARTSFTEAMKVANMAADKGLPVANHAFTTYINVAAALHWLAAVRNALIVEYVVREGPNIADFVTLQKIEPCDGYLDVPQAPGLGVDLNEEAIARFRIF